METKQELRKFVAPEFIFGPGARLLAGRYGKNLGARKILVVSDPRVMATDWVNDILKTLATNEITYTVYSEINPEPCVEEVMAGAEVYQRERCNAIIAIGGGSPIDCAKGIGIVCSNRQHIMTFEGVDKVMKPMPPLICVPTTCGSSADVSQFAVIRDAVTKRKFLIASKALVPDVSLIDPVTLRTLPAYQIACTGFDALSHAIEAYVSNAASPITDLHALEAIRLLSANLIPALANPANPVLSERLMLGSLEAGLAFSNAIVGAVHALSHVLGGFCGVTHGELNAILLEPVIDFNFTAAAERYRRIGEAMGLTMAGLEHSQQKQTVLAAIENLRKAAGLRRSLRDLGIQLQDLAGLARRAMQEPCLVTNPRQPSQQDVEVMLANAL